MILTIKEIDILVNLLSDDNVKLFSQKFPYDDISLKEMEFLVKQNCSIINKLDNERISSKK